MDLLEIALKRSVDWSMRNRYPEDETEKMAAHSVELLKAQRRYESHSRAFVTHFKIELNNLMETKWARENGSFTNGTDNDDDDCDSLNEHDSIDSDAEAPDCSNIAQRSMLSSIELDGKHCGLYNINEQSDDDELVNGVSAERPSTSTQRPSLSSRSSGRRIKDAGEDDADGGYGSLNRGSFRSSLIQELNDIKSRLIDLIDEIDQNVLSQLDEERVEAFLRRKSALVSKLDSLIDGTIWKVHSVSPPADNSDTDIGGSSQTNSSESEQSSSKGDMKPASMRAIIRNKSESEIYSDGYEEQMQVINYDYGRRTSDNNVARAIIDHSNGSSSATGSSREMTRIQVSRDQVDSYVFRNQPIDFGQMMRKFEESKSDQYLNQSEVDSRSIKSTADEKPKVINSVQHVPTSSSTSASSHTSSSSFL